MKNHKANNGLLLYYHPYSMFSQKVLMVLHEKHLTFERKSVNLLRNEQFLPWFLDVNPRGEVPVLKDGHNIITGSSKIIDYLEDNFRNEVKLIPIEEGPRVRQKVTYFRCLVEQIHSGILTLGSCFHEEHLKNCRFPFVKPIRTAIKDAESKRRIFFEVQSELFPEYKNIYQRKIANCVRRYEILSNSKEFAHHLDWVENVLDKIEEELASHTEKTPWLCTETFTVADISLGMLLERLESLGLSHRFWENNQRPHLKQYLVKFRERESYKKSVPNFFTHLRIFAEHHKEHLELCALISGTLIGGWLIYRKYR